MVTGRPSFRYQFFITALALVMVYSVASSLAGFWKMPTPMLPLVLYSVAATAAAWLFVRTPWAGLALVVLAILGVVVGVRYLPNWALYMNLVVQEWREFGRNLQQYQLQATFGPAIGKLFLGASAAGTAYLILREALAKGQAFWSLVLGVVIFGTQWAWYYDRSANYFMTYAVVAFALWTVGQAARRDAGWISSGRKIGYKSHILTPIVWVLALSLVAAVLPTEFAPVDLGVWGERAQEAFPFLKRMRGAGVGGSGGRFSLAATGFSPVVGALGGPVKLDHTVALHLTPSQPLSETAYLRGATFLSYDGTTWEASGFEYKKVPEDGNITSNLGSDVLKSFTSARITPALNFSNTIFNMLEPMRVDGLRSAYRVDQDGNLWAERSIPKGSFYEIQSRIPTYSAEQIRLLSTAGASETYAPYLQVPDTLPRRVGDLARSLTANSTHPYDKAVALEAWLRGMTYDLDAPAAPPGRDFVDFFLFDLQKGYCTYYATAMTVMLRELGIPSRFVEGFAVSTGTQFTEGNNGRRSYAVLNSQAHAWVEAYFPGYGWVTFDPTPRSDLPIINRSTPAPRTDTPDPTDPGSSTATPSTPGDEGPRGMELEEGNEDFGGGTTTQRREWPWALTALVAAAGLVLLGYRRLQLQDRIRSTEQREVVQEAWSKTSWLMSLFNAGHQPHQTPREYAESLSTRWPDLKEPALQVAEDYTIARYAPPEQTIDAEAEPRARALWEKVHEVLFKRYGWRTYLWKRLRWRRGAAE